MAAILDVRILASFLDLSKTSPYMAMIPISVNVMIVMLYPHLNSVYYLTAQYTFPPVIISVMSTKMIPLQLVVSFTAF